MEDDESAGTPEEFPGPPGLDASSWGGPWRLLQSRRHRLGYRDVHVDEIESPDASRRLTWTYFPGQNAVLTLALDDEENVLLVREYRHPLGRDILNLPAGAAGEGSSEEELLAHAQRELAEEACVRAREWTKIGGLFPVPAWSSTRFHLYLARGLEPIPEKGTGDEWCEIEEVARIPFAALHEAVLSGRIEDGMTQLAVLMAAAKGLVSP